MFIKKDKLRNLLMFDHIIRVNLNRELKPVGLNDSNFFVILHLVDEPGVSQERLSQIIKIDHSSMARSIAKMVENDLIKKINDPNDGRAFLLYPTEKAKRLANKLINILDEVYNETFHKLNSKEKQHLIDLYAKANDYDE